MAMNLEHMPGWASCTCFRCGSEWLRIRAFVLLLTALESIAGYSIENVDKHTMQYNTDSVAKGKAIYILNKLRKLCP